MAESPDSSLHFHDYFKILRNRLWVIFTIFVLTVGSGIYVTTQVLQKKYTAAAQVQIQPRGQTSVSGFESNSTDRPFDPTVFQSEFEIMQSRDFLLPIISDLHLDQVWAKRVFKLKDPLPLLVASDYMSGKVLHVDFKRGTNIVEVSAESDLPEEAAAIANAVIDRYKTIRDLEEDQRSGRGIDSLRDRIGQQQQVVNQKKDAVEKLRQEMDIAITPNTGGEAERNDQDLDTRRKDLLQAKIDADARRVLVESVQALPDNQFVDTLTAMGHEQVDITTLRATIFKQESDIENLLKQGFDENHPRVLAQRAELARQREQLKELIDGTRRAIVVDAQMAKSRVDLLEKEVDDLTQKSIHDQTAHLTPYREAQREYENQESILEAYTIRLNQVLADKQLMESPVKIISRATPPDFPSKPSLFINTIVSIIVGLFMGLVVAFLIEYLDTSVKTMGDAESLLGLPVLTVIPNKGGPMPLVMGGSRVFHAEGYRILRAKLDLKVVNGVGPSLTMLSGGPGEGKSTTIYNLAVVCAQAGQSVILVDCDLRRSSVHHMAGVPNDRGVANYLKGEGEATDFIQQTALPNFHVLTGGDMPMDDIGVLAGDKIRFMLDDLKQRYDLVLVDSPPILGISDGSFIAREVDYVILVIQHRRYPREISLRAKRAIEEVHGNCIGMVLNCVAVKSDDSAYYYSNYGNYYKKEDRKKKRDARRSNGKSVLASSRKADLESEEF